MPAPYVVHGRYACFWGGPLSQWYMCKITDGNIVFNCAEQAMMYRKAEHFGDKITMDKIMKAKSPKDQKAWGRQVRSFDRDEWAGVAKKIVYRNNLLKFSQHSDLKQIMLDAGDLIFVEASPYDKIWGIGRGMDYPYLGDKSRWLGKNYLGIVLTRVKKKLQGKYDG